jgi:hypothetical protein
METCSRNYILYKNNVHIRNSANDNYRLQGTQLYLKALDCIQRDLVAFQDTQLHSWGLNLDSNKLSMEGLYESANW